VDAEHLRDLGGCLVRLDGLDGDFGLLMAVGEWAILAGPGWATAPTLDGGEWTSPV